MTVGYHIFTIDKIRWNLLRLFGFTLIFAVSRIEASSPGTSAAEFLKIGIGARSSAMGNANTAEFDDVTSLFFNPAGMVKSGQSAAQFSYNKWLEDIFQGSAGYVHVRNNKDALGLGITYLSMPDITSYDEYDYVQGEIKAFDMAVSAGYSKNITKNTAAGMSLKYIYQALDDTNASALGMDAGYICNPGGGRLNIGAAVRNMGTKIQFDNESYALPSSFNLGISYRMFGRKLALTGEAGFPNDEDSYAAAGAEYRPARPLAFRCGYTNRTDAGDGISVGIGINIRGIELNYAFGSFGILNNTHQVSLIMRRSDKIVEKEIKQEVTKKIVPAPEITEATPEISGDFKDKEVVKPVKENIFEDKQEPDQKTAFVTEIKPGEIDDTVKQIFSTDMDESALISASSWHFEEPFDGVYPERSRGAQDRLRDEKSLYYKRLRFLALLGMTVIGLFGVVLWIFTKKEKK